MEALEPLRGRYNAQHFNLRKFYYECSNLKYLTGLINVPKLGQEPPNLQDTGDAPALPDRPKTAQASKPAPPKAPPTPSILDSTAADIEEQKRMLGEYERKQEALVREREAAQRRQQEEAERLEREHADRLRQQQENERRQQEELQRQQQMQQQMQFQQQDNGRQQQMEMEMLGMRGQYERDQMMLEQYDRVSPLSPNLASCSCN